MVNNTHTQKKKNPGLKCSSVILLTALQSQMIKLNYTINEMDGHLTEKMTRNYSNVAV